MVAIMARFRLLAASAFDIATQLNAVMSQQQHQDAGHKSGHNFRFVCGWMIQG